MLRASVVVAVGMAGTLGSVAARAQRACPAGDEWSELHGPSLLPRGQPRGHCCPEGARWSVSSCADEGTMHAFCASGPVRCGGGNGAMGTFVGNWVGPPMRSPTDSAATTIVRLTLRDPGVSERLDSALGDLLRAVHLEMRTCLASAHGGHVPRQWLAHYRIAGSGSLTMVRPPLASVGVRACFANVARMSFTGGAEDGTFVLVADVSDASPPP